MAVVVDKDNPYKIELIEEFAKEGQTLTMYKSSEYFEDLCRGGHADDGLGSRLMAAGAHGVMMSGTVVQVVVGPEAESLAEDIQDLM